MTLTETRPAWVVNNQAEGTHPGILEVDGIPYQFTIVNASIATGLPYAAAYNPEKGIPLIITDNVPLEFRPFIMTHEVREQTAFPDLPEDKRCTVALVRELQDVRAQEPTMFDDYLENRRDFFEALVVYYENPQQAAAVTESFLRGLKGARDVIQNPAILEMISIK